MPESHRLSITVHFERAARTGRSLEWVAPELRDAGLRMIADQLDDPDPSRTWAGIVDGATFRDLADAWRLPHTDRAAGAPGSHGTQDREGNFTLDGMNWETDGDSPIVCVSLRVSAVDERSPGLARCGRTPNGRNDVPRCAPAMETGSDKTRRQQRQRVAARMT
jgi:hypothetical protein